MQSYEDPSFPGDLAEADSPMIKDLAGGIIWTATWGMRLFSGWCFTSSSMLIPRAVREDDGLRRHFGAEWEMYARRVRYRLIPGIF